MGGEIAAAEPMVAEEQAESAQQGGQELPRVAEMRLPGWFFGFEGVLAGAFDLLKAFPSAWPALVGLGLVNLAVSLTVMRKRLRMAKLLWRGKGTRKVAFTLLGVRLGSHLVLALVGVAVTSVLGHVLFAVAMAALTVAMMMYVQRTALAALVAGGKVIA